MLQGHMVVCYMVEGLGCQENREMGRHEEVVGMDMENRAR